MPLVVAHTLLDVVAFVGYQYLGGALGLRDTFMRDIAFPDSNPVPIVPPPARLSKGSVELSRPPLLGEHSDGVLGSYGFSAEEIAGLRSGGTI